MTNEEKELIVYCLKANSYFHGEICEECKNYPKCDHFQTDSLMEKLIEALEQEPCEDAVSRQAVIDTIYHECSGENLDIDFAKVLLLQRKIKALPSVKPQKTGYWIKYGRLYQCSECKELSCCQGNFCNECGAKMVDPQERSDKE